MGLHVTLRHHGLCFCGLSLRLCLSNSWIFAGRDVNTLQFHRFSVNSVALYIFFGTVWFFIQSSILYAIYPVSIHFLSFIQLRLLEKKEFSTQIASWMLCYSRTHTFNLSNIDPHIKIHVSTVEEHPSDKRTPTGTEEEHKNLVQTQLESHTNQ